MIEYGSLAECSTHVLPHCHTEPNNTHRLSLQISSYLDVLESREKPQRFTLRLGGVVWGWLVATRASRAHRMATSSSATRTPVRCWTSSAPTRRQSRGVTDHPRVAGESWLRPCRGHAAPWVCRRRDPAYGHAPDQLQRAQRAAGAPD